jgi:hypothetical protein
MSPPCSSSLCILNVNYGVYIFLYILILGTLSNYSFLKSTYVIIKKVGLILKHVRKCKYRDLYPGCKEFFSLLGTTMRPCASLTGLLQHPLTNPVGYVLRESTATNE